MTYHCFKGCHWFLPFIPKFYYNKKRFKWVVSFDNSCKYRIGVDQYDSNKLVGISNYLNPRKQSLRFVWNYDPEKDSFRVGIFEEKNYKFKKENLVEIKSNEEVTLELIILDENRVLAKVDNRIEKVFNFPAKKFLYRSNPYFGGNRKCPHYMSIDLKTLI